MMRARFGPTHRPTMWTALLAGVSLLLAGGTASRRGPARLVRAGDDQRSRLDELRIQRQPSGLANESASRLRLPKEGDLPDRRGRAGDPEEPARAPARQDSASTSPPARRSRRSRRRPGCSATRTGNAEDIDIHQALGELHRSRRQGASARLRQACHPPRLRGDRRLRRGQRPGDALVPLRIRDSLHAHGTAGRVTRFSPRVSRRRSIW